MSETVIPSSGRVKQPGANQKYVGSRAGGAAEQSLTKQASIKHQNPEYFKRQSDRKKDSNEGVGRGVGQVGRDESMPRPNMHQANVGNDPGRGVGQVGRDGKKK